MTRFIMFLIFIVCSIICSAEQIGIDFTGATNTALGAGKAGAHDRHANWNSVTGSLGVNIALSDSTGASTTGKLTFTAGSQGETDNLTPENSDRHMMSGWVGLNQNDPGNIQITDIPASLLSSGYDLYVYSDSDAIGKGISFTVNGVTQFFNEVAGSEQLGENPNQFAGKFIEGSGVSLTETNEGNFTIFRNLTASTITLTADSTAGRAAICGIQIVPHRTYQSHSTLIGLYHFDGNLNNNNPIYGGRDGVNDGVSFSSPGASGIGQAVQLSGGGDSVNYNYSLCHERTFVMRLNLDSLPANGNLATILEGNHFNAGFRFLEPWLGVNSSGQIELRAEHINTGGPILRTATINTGQWYHIVYTTNSYESRIYIDGVLAASGAPTLMPSENVYLGSQGNDSEDNSPDSVVGKIDDFRIYRGWLGPEYVAELFNPRSGTPTKPILPFPSNTIKGVPLDKNLEWTPFTSGTTRDVYLGSSPTLTASDRVLTGSSAVNYNPPVNFTANTTYYWRVDEINLHGVTTGDVWSFTTAPASPVGAVDEFTVLTWNIWSGGGRADPIHGRKFVREAIENSGADVVLFQENGSFSNALATDMGFSHTNSATGSNLAIMSKYPILSNINGGGQIGSRIQLSSGREVDIYDLWFSSSNDGANLAGRSSFTNAACISADGGRSNAASNFLAHANLTSGSNPTIVGGDFNTCSHLDFIESTRHQNFYRGDLVWPTTKRFYDADFVDSLRQLAPNILQDPVITWTPFFFANHGEGRGGKARIDLLYHKGNMLTPLSYQFINFDYHPVTLPADHGGFAVTYKWQGLENASNPKPTNGYRVTDLNPTLSWMNASDMTNQKVYFGVNPTLTAADFKLDTTGSSYSLTTLEACSTYYWRIDTVQADGDVITGDVWSFTTPNNCTATNPFPTNGATGVGSSSLSWTLGVGAVIQHIYFGRQPSLTAVDRQPDETGGAFSAGNLLENTTYYLKVDTVLANGDIIAGEVWSFTTGGAQTSNCQDSSEWAYRYEANALLSDVSSGSWLSQNGDTISSVSGGILTMANTSTGDQRYIRDNMLTNANGWSVETRVKVTNAGTKTSVWQIIPRDGTLGTRLFVGASGIGNDSSNGNSITHSFDFTDDFHVIRLALNPANDQLSLWIDGKIITNNFGSVAVAANHIIVGNSSSSIQDGAIQVDYLRVEDEWCSMPNDLVGVGSYQAWVLENFPTALTNDPSREATDWGEDADPEGDEISNLKEYAFGGDPSIKDPSILPKAIHLGNDVAIAYRRLKGGSGVTGISYTAGGISYRVQVSETLKALEWNAGSDYFDVEGTPTDNGDGTETIQLKLKIPANSNPQRIFSRVDLELES